MVEEVLDKMSHTEQINHLKKQLSILEAENVLLKEVAKNANESRNEVKRLQKQLESFAEKGQELNEIERKEPTSQQQTSSSDSWFLNNLKNQQAIKHNQK